MHSRFSVSSGNPIIIPTMKEIRAVREGRTLEIEAPLPKNGTPKPVVQAGQPSLLGTTAGFFKAAIAATLLGAMGTTAFAQEAPQIPRTFRGEITGTLSGENPAAASAELDHQYGRLDALLAGGRITPSELAIARAILHRVLIDNDQTIVLPRDARGRIDLLTLARLGDSVTDISRTRGEMAFANLTRDLETMMRVTARDVANPDTRFIEGAPGYKWIAPEQVREVVGDALRNVPLGELPGGRALAGLVKLLPNMADVDAEHLSYREIERLLPDRSKAWLEARFGPLIEGHEIEASIVAFAAITGLRAGSSGAAQFIDGLGVRLRIVDAHTEDGRLFGKGTLVYRDRHIFPDLDLETGARYVIGNTTLRATVTGTIAPEAEGDQRLRGNVTLGARYGGERLWIDSAVDYFAPEERVTATVRGGYLTESEWNITGGVTSTYLRDVQIGRSPGRVNIELDITKDLRWNGATGDFGFYIGAGSDVDGQNRDLNAGLVFRLSW
jgi:hypothetical protein